MFPGLSCRCDPTECSFHGPPAQQAEAARAPGAGGSLFPAMGRSVFKVSGWVFLRGARGQCVILTEHPNRRADPGGCKTRLNLNE